MGSFQGLGMTGGWEVNGCDYTGIARGRFSWCWNSSGS